MLPIRRCLFGGPRRLTPWHTTTQARFASDDASSSNQDEPAPATNDDKSDAKPNKRASNVDAILSIMSPYPRVAARLRRQDDSNTLISPLSAQGFPSPQRRKLKADPFFAYAGRTKVVENGDLSGAFRSLGYVLRNNKVAADYRYQKFYKKPSDLRVQLESQRHRKRFLSGVRRLVGLVKQQKKFL